MLRPGFEPMTLERSVAQEQTNKQVSGEWILTQTHRLHYGICVETKIRTHDLREICGPRAKQTNKLV